jgi:Pectate lyase superfamily protein
VLLLLYEMKISCYFLLLLWAGQLAAQERGARLPYIRYGSEEGRTSGASLVADPEATGRRCVCLKAQGAAIEWTIRAEAQGFDLRFTLPDNATGTGMGGVIELYVNGRKMEEVALSSYWAYQYFRTGVSDPFPTRQEKTFMRFDEVHFRLKAPVRAGDTVRLQKDGRDTIGYGIDFIELEPLPAVMAPPAGALSVTSYGAVPDDEEDDWAAFNACIRAAMADGKSVYIPPGRYLLSDKLDLEGAGLKIRGAGIWYTQLYFSTNRQAYGGIVARASEVEMADFSLNTANNGRLQYGEEGARMPRSKYKQYKGISGTFGSGSYLHDLWVEHFECGFWIAGYDPPGAVPVTQGLVIKNCRMRNNYADGVNFSQGTSHSVVENCSIRNNGDDGMAVWPNNGAGVRQPCVEDTFRNNTVEDNWRAAGAAIFGGWGHRIDHNLFLGGVGGSAIRMTNDFSGFGFDSSQEVITVVDNTIAGSGTTADIWNRPKGAVELDASKGIYHVLFDGTVVEGSQWEPVHIVGRLAGVVFRGTVIDGQLRDVKVN